MKNLEIPLKLVANYQWWAMRGPHALLCHRELIEVFPVVRRKTRLVGIVSATKPRHSNFFTIREPEHIIGSLYSKLKETRRDLISTFAGMLGEWYDKGYRYVWLEYDE